MPTGFQTQSLFCPVKKATLNRPLILFVIRNLIKFFNLLSNDVSYMIVTGRHLEIFAIKNYVPHY